jgi:hypothetical protein
MDLFVGSAFDDVKAGRCPLRPAIAMNDDEFILVLLWGPQPTTNIRDVRSAGVQKALCINRYR